MVLNLIYKYKFYTNKVASVVVNYNIFKLIIPTKPSVTAVFKPKRDDQIKTCVNVDHYKL